MIKRNDSKLGSYDSKKDNIMCEDFIPEKHNNKYIVLVIVIIIVVLICFIKILN